MIVSVRSSVPLQDGSSVPTIKKFNGGTLGGAAVSGSGVRGVVSTDLSATTEVRRRERRRCYATGRRPRRRERQRQQAGGTAGNPCGRAVPMTLREPTRGAGEELFVDVEAVGIVELFEHHSPPGESFKIRRKRRAAIEM